MIEKHKIYELIQKYFIQKSNVNRNSVALDLLNIMGCQNVNLIKSIIDGCEFDDQTIIELDNMIECHKP
jgi:hypothetical protein